MGNPGWPYLTFRIFGVANFVIAILGMFLLLLSSVSGVLGGAIGDTPAQPHFIIFYWAMVVINLCFLGLLVLGGIYLLQLRTLGVVVCNVVFVAEIVYFVIFIGFLWSPAVSKAISASAAGATGVGNMGISPQLVSGYPLIALVCLNLARWRLTRQRRQSSSILTPQVKS